MLIKKFTALIALILVAALFLSACTPQGVTVAPESAAPPNPTASPTPPPVAVTPAPPTAAPEPSFVIYEYGEPSAIVEQEHSFFSCYLLYPTTGLAEVDGVISGWAHEVYDSARAEILALRETDPSAEGEINVQYNAYRVSDNFVSVVEFVFYSHSGLAHPIERVKVFNIDIANGALVANDRVLSVERHAEALALLRGKIVAELPQLDEVLGDLRDDWLDNLVVTHEGVDVVLARGEHLPSVVGTRSYTLTFEELGDAFVLLNEPPEPQPSATPEPSHAFYPPPQISVPPNRELDPDKPMIALTFDDGPSEHTEKILDLLEQYNSRATFCVLGNRVDRYAETIKRAAEMGCEVVGHSWDHKYLTKLTPDGIREELTSTNQALYDATGYWPPYYRPPYGAMNDAVREVTIELNLSMLLWSIDPRDWQSRNADEICAIINDKARDGGIIICHDIYGSTVEAMERAIPGLIDMGYQLVTVSELLGGRTIEPGSEILRR